LSPKNRRGGTVLFLFFITYFLLADMADKNSFNKKGGREV
jgi:hypothetical protein